MKRLLALSLALSASLAQAAPINVYSISGPGGAIDPSLTIQYLAQYPQYNPALIAPTAPILSQDGTIAAPSFAFASESNLGFYRAGTNQIGVALGGKLKEAIGQFGYRLASDGLLAWRNNLDISQVSANDVILSRGAAGVLSLSDTANPQTFLIYGTTVGPQYLLLSHDGTNAQIDTAASSGAILIGNTNATKVVIRGTATNDSAAAGMVGEILTGTLAVGSATSLVTATAKDVATVALTAGDWDCSGVIDFKPAATTNATLLLFGSSSTSNTLGADDTFGSVVFLTAGQVTTNGDYRNVIPTQRFSLSGTTTIRLVGQATFTVSTMTAYGSIRCRRVR